ncbi:MAG: tetratricopeptide repeat protein [Candidatus Omnitrophota bacterium]|nr:tetratricopeptide repeat protein [Candidatus Omnitrophota bacterium]
MNRVYVKMVRSGIMTLFLFLAFCGAPSANVSVKAPGVPQVSPLHVDGPWSGNLSDLEIYDTIRGIKMAIKENPQDYTNYQALAFVYDYIGRHDKAAEALELEIRYYPKENITDLGIAYGNLARQYIILRRLDDAKPVIDESLKLAPNNRFNHWRLLSYYTLKGRYKEAALELKVLSELSPKGDVYYELLIYAYEEKVTHDGIIEIFREAVRVNPDSHKSHRMLATAIKSSPGGLDKNFSLVMEEYNKALELDPEYIPTYISIAGTYMLRALCGKDKNKKYFNDSLEWFNKAYEIEPENVKLAYAMGELFMRMEQYDQAINKLEYTVSKTGNAPEPVDMLAAAYNDRAYQFYKTGENMEEGLALIDKAINLRPDNGIILSTKAELLYKMGRLNEAYDYIKRGIALAPGHEEIQQDLENIEKALLGLDEDKR